jgi:hypothetical protein
LSQPVKIYSYLLAPDEPITSPKSIQGSFSKIIDKMSRSFISCELAGQMIARAFSSTKPGDKEKIKIL